MAQQQSAKKLLIYSILKFLDGEYHAETTNSERRESLEVGIQCLETVFDVTLANPQAESIYGPALDLLSIASINSTATSDVHSFTSWMGATDQPAMSVPLTDDMRQQADKLKSEGNDLVKQEKYKEALNAYNAAIQIDSNNAIYYCNRAAAHNKLSNNDQAISDCFRSIEIDPNYSKAYGRLGVIYLSLEKLHEARDAYKQALALEPTNDNYKQSIRICEDRLTATMGGAQAAGGPAGLPPNLGAMFGSMMGGQGGGPGGQDMMSLFNNPQLMNMAMQFVQNPQVQGLMANLVTNLSTQEGGDVGLETLLQTGQRMATELSSNNPDLIESIRRNMGNRPPSNNNESPSGDNPENGSDPSQPPSS